MRSSFSKFSTAAHKNFSSPLIEYVHYLFGISNKYACNKPTKEVKAAHSNRSIQSFNINLINRLFSEIIIGKCSQCDRYFTPCFYQISSFHDNIIGSTKERNWQRK